MSAAAAQAARTATGFYHCSVKGIGRANGRSIVAAAAYRRGERLEDEITGTVADYRARGGVVDKFVLAPEDAPAWAHDSGKLWNAAERAENASNGRLATELELALPHELNAAQRKELLETYLRPLIERYGVAADVAIHQPGKGKDHRNVHAHVLITHRQLGPEGFGEVANQRLQMRKRKGEQKLEKISGIAATPADIRAIRKDWEQAVNHAYELAGLDIRVDHRSHKDRGISQEPTVHLGPEAEAIEQRGGVSELATVNREITRRNAEREEIAKLEAQVGEVTAQIYSLQIEHERRYGPVEETHRDVQREQIEARYNILRAAELPPENVRLFEAGAARTTEPDTPIFDRDAADADWHARLESAAIANDNTKREPEPVYDRDQADAEWRAKVEAAAIASDQEQRQNTRQAQAEKKVRPLSSAAAELRLAWTLSRGSESLEDALAARGWTLAQATPDEAEQSQRTAAFARAAGRFATSYEAGEIVAVNLFGSVYRLNEHTTGDAPAEITAQLAWIDRDSLLAVTPAQEAMEKARETIGRDEWRQWRDETTPLTSLETGIADALANTMTGFEFAAELNKAGITLTRATASDVLALDALRKEAELAATVARTEALKNDDPNGRHFGVVAEGEFVAITRKGDVFRLNPTALDFEEAEQRLADTQPRLPSVVEVRIRNEELRNKAAAKWKQHQANNAARATARFEARQWQESFHNHFRKPVEAAVRSAIAETAATGSQALSAAQDVLRGASKAVEGAIGFLGGMFGAAEPKLTRQQLEDILRVRTDPQMLRDQETAATVHASWAEHNDRLHVQKTAQQECDLRLSQTLGTPATAEANLNRDEYERQREQERERGGRSL